MDQNMIRLNRSAAVVSLRGAVDADRVCPQQRSALATVHQPRRGMPRLSSTVALAALLVIAIIFLIRSSPSQPAYYRDVLGGHGLSLSAWLSREETRYAKVLQERQQLITKWGPTNELVNP
jgi:hypothetical protein